MATEQANDNSVESDAAALAERYGPDGEIYAQTRSEAAEIAGDEAAKRHWKKVASAIPEDADQ